MSDIFVNLIDLNEGIDYPTFIMLFCSYLLLLWLVISIWVGVDAYRRFGNKMIGLAFFLLTFFLNFPILIFYFIIRPEIKYEDYQDWETQGVNVPLVNFKGEKGVEMVLELKMQQPQKVDAHRDMKIDVSWESQRKEMELKNLQAPEAAIMSSEQNLEPDLKPRADRKVVNVFSNFGGIVKKKIMRFKEVSADYTHLKRKKKAGIQEDLESIKTEDLSTPAKEEKNRSQKIEEQKQKKHKHNIERKKNKSKKRKRKNKKR